MFKSDKSPQTLKGLYTITPLHKAMIDRFIVEKGALSQSDVVRQAISFFYSKTFPGYVDRETAAGQMKKKTLEEKTYYENLTDEDFVRETFPGAVILPSTDGSKYVIVQVYGNSLDAYPLQGFKETAANDPLILQFHMEGHTKRPTPKMFSGYSKSSLTKNHGIIFPDNFNGVQ